MRMSGTDGKVLGHKDGQGGRDQILQVPLKGFWKLSCSLEKDWKEKKVNGNLRGLFQLSKVLSYTRVIARGMESK